MEGPGLPGVTVGSTASNRQSRASPWQKHCAGRVRDQGAGRSVTPALPCESWATCKPAPECAHLNHLTLTSLNKQVGCGGRSSLCPQAVRDQRGQGHLSEWFPALSWVKPRQEGCGRGLRERGGRPRPSPGAQTRTQTRAPAAVPCGWCGCRAGQRDETVPRMGEQDGETGFAGVRDGHARAATQQSPRAECPTGRDAGGEAGNGAQGRASVGRGARGPPWSWETMGDLRVLIRQVCRVQTLHQLLPWVLGTHGGVSPAPLRLRAATGCREGGGCGLVQGEVGSGEGSLGS